MSQALSNMHADNKRLWSDIDFHQVAPFFAALCISQYFKYFQVLMLMLCCSDFTWVQCDRHLVRSWTDNLKRENLEKKSFSRWVLDKSSFVYNWDFPPWHEAAWWLQWWWPNHGLCHQDHGGKWGWPEEEKNCNTRDHDWSICLWNRVLGRGRDDNGIWHFCLSWCLLCELKYKRFGAEMRKIRGRWNDRNCGV